MVMTAFKIGDQVVAIENDKEYKGFVTHISEKHVTIKTEKFGSTSFYNTQVQLIKPAASAPKYKVGDKVKVVKNTAYNHHCDIGSTVEITKIYDNTDIECQKTSTNAQILHVNDVEPIVEENPLPEGTLVRRINMKVQNIQPGEEGIATGVTAKCSTGMLYHINWIGRDKCTYSRLENLEVISVPNQIADNVLSPYRVTSVMPDSIVLETVTGRASGPAFNVQNLHKSDLDELVFADYTRLSVVTAHDVYKAFAAASYFSQSLKSPIKENTMSLKIKTTYTVQGAETKNWTIDATAEAIREQTANIKALEDLPVKTNKISEQIEELKADLTAFIDHMDSLPKSKS
jgi:hypothetical protein